MTYRTNNNGQYYKYSYGISTGNTKDNATKTTPSPSHCERSLVDAFYFYKIINSLIGVCFSTCALVGRTSATNFKPIIRSERTGKPHDRRMRQTCTYTDRSMLLQAEEECNNIIKPMLVAAAASKVGGKMQQQH